MGAALEQRPVRVEGRILIYDAGCAMCTGFTHALIGLRLIGAADRRAFQDFPEPEAARLLAAGIQNEILVLDPATGELRGGAAGLLWKLAETRLAPLARLAARRPAVDVMDGLYRFVAYNRRFFSTPAPRTIACACDPADRPPYQVAFVLVCAAVAAASLFFLGAVAPRELGLAGSRAGAWEPLLRAGGPWILPALLACTLSPGATRRYLAHLAATAAAGALVLAALALAYLFAPAALAPARGALLLCSCAAAGVLMFAMQRRRVAFQGLRRGWLWGWAACASAGLVLLLRS